MDFIIATNNKDKVKEIKTILAGHNVISQSEAGICLEADENGTTFRENALIKARSLKGFTNAAIIADDSGIEADALGGAPGVYSARYAGEDGTPHDCNEKLLRELRDVPYEQRTARYICCMALIFPDGREFTFEGKCEGHILFEYRGTNGFGYDPLFFSDDLKMTFGEASPEAKDKVSHRYLALKKLSDFLQSENA